MNKVEFSAEGLPLPPWKKKAGNYVQKVLQKLERKNWDVSILFCGNEYIKALNARYRNMDEPTDVLSFELGETVNNGRGDKRYLPGDIVISLDFLKTNADVFGVSEDEELRRLLIHGILHLHGMDHATDESGEPMLELQEKILSSLGGEQIL